MAKIAFILLCHKDPDAIIAQAVRLTAAGDYVSIHFDARATDDDYARIQKALRKNTSVVMAGHRVKGGWGEWSLVQGSLNAVREALQAFPKATHFYLLSGDCAPIKTADYIHKFLDREDADYIESFDFFKSDWIKTGLREERLVYRHFFNERSQKEVFYTALNWQKRLGLKRKIPADLEIMIGSQWWCLRRQTIETILAFIAKRRDVVRFFRRSWIPDETFFQTLVRHLVPETEIRSQTLTFLMFTDYGLPVNFHDDHYDMLIGQDFLFARKISPEAHALKERLGDLFAAHGVKFQISNEGKRLHAFLTSRGRIGQRFAPRFWEKEATLGRERELYIVTCKKWHVAKRLLDQFSQVSNLPLIEYLFDEEVAALPDLGGIQDSIAKRTRHRRALLRMLFDYFETDRLLICLDPSNIELFRDFHSDRSKTRVLEVECAFTDAYLVGHARRVGLLGADSTPETEAAILPTIRNDIALEADRLRDEKFPEHQRYREDATREENIDALTAFLSVSKDQAARVVDNHYVFAE